MVCPAMPGLPACTPEVPARAAGACGGRAIPDPADVARQGPFVAMPAPQAMDAPTPLPPAFDAPGPRTAGARDRIAGRPAEAPSMVPRLQSAVPRLVDAPLGEPSAASSAPSAALW